MTTELIPTSNGHFTAVAPDSNPPILLGNASPAVAKRVRSFYLSVEQMFEAWIGRHKSSHTQRTYRQSVMDFIEHLGIEWPKDGIVHVVNQVTDLMLDFEKQDERFGEVVQSSEDVSDAEDAEQVVVGADQDVVDVTPVGFGVDVNLPTDKPGWLHRLANGKLRGLDFGGV